MGLPLEQALIEVWRQALVKNAKSVELGGERFPVRHTLSVDCGKWTSCLSPVVQIVQFSLLVGEVPGEAIGGPNGLRAQKMLRDSSQRGFCDV